SDCDPEAAAPACSEGICTRNGRCAPDEPDREAGRGGALVLGAELGVPTVVLLVDQSGSMSEPYSGGSRGEVPRAALLEPTNGVISELETLYRFGLTLYTAATGGACPDLTTVDPALNNRDAIATVYNAASPELYTPTGEAIEAVTQ